MNRMVIYMQDSKTIDFNKGLRSRAGCSLNACRSLGIQEKTHNVNTATSGINHFSISNCKQENTNTQNLSPSSSKLESLARTSETGRTLTAEPSKRIPNIDIKYFINVMTKRIYSYLNLKSSYFQIILALAFSTTSFANTEFRFTPRSKIEAQISSDELNRIEVTGGDIMEVIGDEGKYSLYWSSDWRNLFIKPKVPAGETFELSLIFFGGLAQDIRLTAGDTTAKTIIIDKDNNYSQHIPHSYFHPTAKHKLQPEVTAMMRAMFEGIKGKYYVTDTKRLLKYTASLQLTQIKAYRYKDLSGAVVIVTNISKSPVQLSEEDFRGLFKGTLAVNLKSLNIAPKQKTTLFIVTKGGVNDK